MDERDFRPMVNPSSPVTRPDDWMLVSAVCRRTELSRKGPSLNTMIERAAAGQLRAWARRIVVGATNWSGGELPSAFWRELGPLADQRWELDEFSVAARVGFDVRARNVHFNRNDLTMLFPAVFKPPPSKDSSAKKLATAKPDAKAKGGRKPLASWPEWVAELVHHIHEHGYPDGEGTEGVDIALKAVADGLAERGLDGPARATAQTTMRAVLLRWRTAGN